VADLQPVAAALTKQIASDFGPAWSIAATVDVAAAGAVPDDAWTITVLDGLDDSDEPGYHRSANGRPYAKVLSDADWRLTVGHECLEMLVDPSGDRRIAGPRLPPEQGTVDYLLEVCDPCQDQACAYAIDGVPVSDFILPGYYDEPASSAGRYSFNHAITSPRGIAAGGYLSWFTADGHVWQTEAGSDRQLTTIEYDVINPTVAARQQVDQLARQRATSRGVGTVAGAPPPSNPRNS
jgi:hypothetical protein